jgi:hypothetical protein
VSDKKEIMAQGLLPVDGTVLSDISMHSLLPSAPGNKKGMPK